MLKCSLKKNKVVGHSILATFLQNVLCLDMTFCFHLLWILLQVIMQQGVSFNQFLAKLGVEGGLPIQISPNLLLFATRKPRRVLCKVNTK